MFFAPCFGALAQLKTEKRRGQKSKADIKPQNGH
jgi:hypothetical protein